MDTFVPPVGAVCNRTGADSACPPGLDLSDDSIGEHLPIYRDPRLSRLSRFIGDVSGERDSINRDLKCLINSRVHYSCEA